MPGVRKRPTTILALLCSFGLHQYDAFLTIQQSRKPGHSMLKLTDGHISITHLAAQMGHPDERKRRGRRSNHQRYRQPHHNRGRRSYDPQQKEESEERRAWLVQATNNVVSSEPGSLVTGHWHELVSMLKAWSRRSKFDPEAPIIVERVFKRLLDEKAAGNFEVSASTELYNILLDAWACAAIFRTREESTASQRAREILVSLQEAYEEGADADLKPDAQSFHVVLHAVCRTEGPVVARRVLAWMEYLYKVGKNADAKPTRKHYIMILDAYANSKRENAGVLVEGFLRHMKVTGVTPDTYCYNIAIKAWIRSKGGRESAEHADRILEEMEAPKDLVTYSTVISAWAASGMRSHAVARAEELLKELNEAGLEPNTIVMNSVMSTWVKSRNPAAVNRTADMLEQMELSSTCLPDLFSYNTHLHALSMHAKRPGYAKRASDLIASLEEKCAAGEVHLRPNLFSYNLAIDAWSKADDYDAAWNAVKILRKMIDREWPRPDTFSFNQVFIALSRSSRPGAAQLSERLLQYMVDGYRLGIHKNARPDVFGFTSVIVALARSGEADAAERAESLVEQMKKAHAAGEKFLKPTRVVYNALIDCWAKSGRGTFAARKAEAILQEMEALGAQGDTTVSPNIVTYNAVLNSWARSGTRCCANKAEEYLERMWELHKGGVGGVAPNDKSFNTVINAISKSPNEFKGQKALRLLRRMDKLYQAGYKEARPNEVTYTSVLNSCAFTASLDERTRRKAFDTAIFTLQELQASRYGSPNDIAYGTFMQACANLLSEDDEMLRGVIEEAFQQCCKDGQVGEMVLYHLRDAAPEDLFSELLREVLGTEGSINIDTINIEDLPPEWRRNVFGSRKERIDGRRSRVNVQTRKKLLP
mmetsp:Transcript_90360/g.260513  ORF Transcript_90360/g.260513 Transcript_90360/m.260513 type:complete len:876 (-) Transcript_90360:45-2672(-)|eukprot:CAMPEP_0176121104 /NCGR_PEP_ID=MMETSP0120_2-20121206/60942_1 /TAXON_ID=160619 /ORGANISM="Kryptoperidinium foliaceum, Strain CCMP 1326" /LENGTH=875 /DNA_ID=CAMNT_0017455617 /DNA_START=117 /DNA_END=2744 /DNA_ORIENTATION=-